MLQCFLAAMLGIHKSNLFILFFSYLVCTFAAINHLGVAILTQKSRYYLLLLLLVSCLQSRSQNKEQTLEGNVHLVDGIVCKYKLVFTYDDEVIKGYSIIWQPDGREMMAGINGQINKILHTMEFKETNQSNNPKNNDCMFEARLQSRSNDGKYTIKGNFKGKDRKNRYCDEGFMEFKLDQKPSFLFDAPIIADGKNSKVERERLSKSQLSNEFIKVTSDSRTSFEWATDTCYMDIWDGQAIDGDRVTITFNNKKMLVNYALSESKWRLALPLTKSINKLTITAENEGLAPPNTSQIVLADKYVTRKVIVSIELGKSADIFINRK